MIGITKSEFETSLFRQDVVDYYLNMSIDDIRYKFGDIGANMVGFSQNNPNHCYDLFEHTLRTVADIPGGELADTDVKEMKIAAFFHDIAKPIVAKNEQGRVVYPDVEIESAKIAVEYLTELGYENAQINRICFLILHINDFLYYKDEVPYYYEHHAIIKKISTRTIAERMLENHYNFESLGLSNMQIKAVCYALTRNEEWPLYENEKGDEVFVKPVDLQDVICRLVDIKQDYVPTLKDYVKLLKLSIANYKAQAKRSFQRGKLIATRAEKVRVAAIIEALLPESFNLFEELVNKYQADGVLTQELIDVTNEYNELVSMNKIEQMREDNAKNLMHKFNDMKIRLSLKS